MFEDVSRDDDVEPIIRVRQVGAGFHDFGVVQVRIVEHSPIDIASLNVCASSFEGGKTPSEVVIVIDQKFSSAGPEI
ncbi:hypothetical protein NCCNTM_48500 [Mycolicibacterium sp. NCC-Tsukiji]|nr:hypothetical protein NCCNTM_48500 [Mycolicibacterium sp. NCC-Tsukiji]